MAVTYTMVLTHKPWQWLQIEKPGFPDNPDHALLDPQHDIYRLLKMEIESYVSSGI